MNKLWPLHKYGSLSLRTELSVLEFVDGNNYFYPYKLQYFTRNH